MSIQNITIRRAALEDLKIIQRFGYELLDYERQNWDPALDINWPFSKEGEQKYRFAITDKYTIIAEKDKKSAGYLIGKIVGAAPGSARNIKQAYLENIFVSDSARKSGVGAKLITEFKDYCKKEGVSRINVSVLAANTTAVDFYQKVGFSPRSLSLSQELK
jgi:GNAT superfamily N-acetyltransferase